MKQETDTRTMDLPLPGGKRRRGRPATGGMSGAERQRAYRARLAEEGKAPVSVTLSADVVAALDKFVQFKDETKGEAVDRILRDRLLRKR